MNDSTPHPHPLIALIPLLTLIALIACVLIFLPDDALSGGSQVAMLMATALCVTISMTVYKVKWSTFEQAICDTVAKASVSIILLLLIGMMSATWTISGVVPTLIYYGVQIMTPMFFLPCACIISAIISVMTGTSWTTIATIGVALMGIGTALGIPAPYTAGAIISGAYFGDKLSPMSDTTVLAATMAGADLFAHIRFMMYTTVPSMAISLILYAILGFSYDGETPEATVFTEGLSQGFNISLWTLLVPAFTGWMIYKKVPSLPVLLLSSLAASVCAVILQPDVLTTIAGETTVSAKAIFVGLMKIDYTTINLDLGHEEINRLVTTRGMGGMLDSIWLILCALNFGSCMVVSGMLKSLTSVMLRSIHNTASLVCSSAISGCLLNLIMGDQFLSIVMNCSIFREEYTKRGYVPELLSRSTEDSATVTSVLVPWTACGMTQSTVLGIPTLVYLPFCFFCILSPIMSCIVGILGYEIPKPNPVADENAK